MPRDDREVADWAGLPEGHPVTEDQAAGFSPDAARQGGGGVDRTGFSEMMTIMLAVHQWVDAARASGFSSDQAFQLGRDYFAKMMEMSAERSE